MKKEINCIDPQSALKIQGRGLDLLGHKERNELEMGLKTRILNENLYGHSKHFHLFAHVAARYLNFRFFSKEKSL